MVAVVAFAAPALAATNPFMDVPQGHWSYDAVGLLASRGIVSGYPDGAFKGAQPATRYEMASVVARALVTVDAEKASKQDLELLKKLVMEFKDELDALGVKVDALDKRVAVLEDRLGGWKFNGQFWFDAKFASDDDNGQNSYNTNGDNQFGFAYARLMVTKYLDENNFFFMRLRSNVGSGDLTNWLADRFYVSMQLPWDVRMMVGRIQRDWEGDANLYNSVMGDNEGGVWQDQKLDGFNFQKSFGMLDGELIIGRNDDMISNRVSGTYMDRDAAQRADGENNATFADDNAFMQYALKLNFNFSENFKFGLMGAYFDADNVDLSEYDAMNSAFVVGENLDLAQYGAYLGYNFTPSIALRGYFYMQDLDDGWRGADIEDNPMTWSAMLDIKQDLLKFTSLWVQYVEMDNTWVGNRATDKYPAVFTPGDLEDYAPIGTDGTNKTWLVTAQQQWNDKWESFLQYMTTDWDAQGFDDTDQYMIGIGYQYTPQVKFWLAYNYIDYNNGGAKYEGSESVVLFRTAIDF